MLVIEHTLEVGLQLGPIFTLEVLRVVRNVNKRIPNVRHGPQLRSKQRFQESVLRYLDLCLLRLHVYVVHVRQSAMLYVV